MGRQIESCADIWEELKCPPALLVVLPGLVPGYDGLSFPFSSEGVRICYNLIICHGLKVHPVVDRHAFIARTVRVSTRGGSPARIQAASGVMSQYARLAMILHWRCILWTIAALERTCSRW